MKGGEFLDELSDH